MYTLSLTLATLAATGGFLLTIATLLLPNTDDVQYFLLALVCFAFASTIGIWVIAEQVKSYLDQHKA